MQNTLRFEIVVGINRGYFNYIQRKSYLRSIGAIWQDLAKKEFDNSNLYISAVIKPSITIYNEKWGCPRGGEDTVVITGVANEEFIQDIENWKNTVIKLAKQLKEKLGQSTITCEFMKTELYYFK